MQNFPIKKCTPAAFSRINTDYICAFLARRRHVTKKHPRLHDVPGCQPFMQVACVTVRHVSSPLPPPTPCAAH
ncbi:hypothetical protein CEXT_701761 [Caerostris extrusa]|uniref:Uncharacterized protein n=1 Tax=Caerostris extrusa TaxID=172846 RepID=A0AAV4Y0M7_CAEEX|nr:hypothetical protein CEXT_701761 [Caerostris extrusa]